MILTVSIIGRIQEVVRYWKSEERCVDIISYHIILYYLISYHIKSYHIILYYIISYYIIWYYIILYHIISYHIISHHIISYHIILYYITPYHIISYHGICSTGDGTYSLLSSLTFFKTSFQLRWSEVDVLLTLILFNNPLWVFWNNSTLIKMKIKMGNKIM